MSKPKIDLFKMMAAIDRGDSKFLESLSEEERKTFGGWTEMIWASAVKNTDMAPFYIEMLNEYVNKNMSALNKHPELLFKLMTVVGMGDTFKHEWVGVPQAHKKSKIQQFLSELYPGASRSDLELMEQINDKNDLKDLARQHNYPENDIKKWFS